MIVVSLLTVEMHSVLVILHRIFLALKSPNFKPKRALMVTILNFQKHERKNSYLAACANLVLF